MGSFFGTISGCAGAIGSGWLNAFGIFYYQALGLSTGEIGQIYATIGIVVACLVLVSGWLADIYHPIRVAMAGAIGAVFIINPVCLIWLFWHPTHQIIYWASMAIGVVVMAPVIALNGVYDRHSSCGYFREAVMGNFVSTNAIWRSLGGIIGGVLGRCVFGCDGPRAGAREQAYFCAPLWQLMFGIPGFYTFLKLYQCWKKHGGDAAYVPPVINSAEAIPNALP